MITKTYNNPFRAFGKTLRTLCALCLLCALCAACTGDYTDWASPFKTDPEAAKTMTMSVSPAATIDFANVTAETVQIFVPNVTIDDESENSFIAVLAGPEEGDNATFETDANGYVATADLETGVYALYGQRPIARQIPVTVTGLIKVGGQTFKGVGTTTLTVIPSAPDIEVAYYLTGSINGWDNTDTTYKLTNDGSDPYENPVYTCRIPAPEDGSNVEFKFTPESGLGGDWSKCLAGGSSDGKFNYNNDGGNLVIQAVEGAKYYDITFDMMEQTWAYQAVSFDPFIYFIGATDGWSASDQKLALANTNGLYTGYLYIADPNGWGVEFKFQRVPGSWDNEINFGTFSAGVTGDFTEGGGGNIKAEPGAGVYYVEADLGAGTLKGTLITNMNLVGDFNGWNAGDDSQQMTWDAENFCYVITGAGVTANGWKFTTNNSWDVNLGGDSLDNLVANGPNITAVGTTIKLYPTRKTSDNIYCTVE